MAIIFSDLHTDSGLKSLDEFLSRKSYVSGDNITKDDIKVYATVLVTLSPMFASGTTPFLPNSLQGLGLPMDTENGSDLGVTGSTFTASKHLHPLMLKSPHDPDFAADKANTQSKASQSQATPLPPNNPFEEVLWPTMRAKLDANPTTQAYLQNNDFVRIMHELHNAYLKDKRVIQAPTSADAEMPQSLSSPSLRERKRGMKAEPAEELDPMKYIEQPQHDPDFAADKVAQPPVNDDFDSNQFPLWERMGRLLIGLFLMVLLILSIGWL